MGASRGKCGAYTNSREQTQHHTLLLREGLMFYTGMQRISRYRYLMENLQLTSAGKSNKCRSLGHDECSAFIYGLSGHGEDSGIIHNVIVLQSSCARLFPCTPVCCTGMAKVAGVVSSQLRLLVSRLSSCEKMGLWCWPEKMVSQTFSPLLIHLFECCWHCVMNGSCWAQPHVTHWQLTRVCSILSDKLGFDWEMS